MSGTVVKNALVYDGGAGYRGWLFINDGVFARIGAGDPDEALASGAERVIDAGGRIAMPALYNAHTHAAMTLMRGVGSDLPLQRWLTEAIFPREEGLTPEICYWGTMLAIAEMARFGTAGCVDMYYHMGEAARAAVDAGFRMCATWASSLENQRALLADWDGAAGLVRVMPALHAEYSTEAEEVSAVAELAAQTGRPVHVHVSETEREHRECIARRGCTPTEYFDRLHLFDCGGIAAHCVWTERADWDILRRRGVFAVHNPVSNLKLGSGVMDMPAMLGAGVSVALGTDGCASNNNLNLFEELRLAAMLHKGVRRDPTLISPAQAIASATHTGAAACGFDRCGRLEEGWRADMVLLDVSAPHAVPMPALPDHIAYSAQGSDVYMTMINGKIVYMDGCWPTMDIERVRARAGECAALL